MIDYPHLWNTGAPTNYLHLATFMLFTRSIVKDLQFPKKLDFFLMSLPIVSFLTMLSFYLKDVTFKINHINYILENEDAIFYATESFIPAYWNYVFQFSFGILFSGIAVFLISKDIYRKEKGHLKSVVIWLVCVASLMFLGNLIGLTSLIFDSSSYDIHSLDAYIFGLYILIIFLYPFFEPKVLYGALLDVKKKIGTNSDIKQEFSDEELETYKTHMKSFFDLEDSYLKPDFRQNDLSSYLDISKSKLHQIILGIYGKKFNQLINEKRIEVVLEKFRNSDWLNFSLEGVSLEVGYKSRTTFIKAFKEKTGVTPSEYKKKLQANLH
jgi:AraC-like DNA-binding protein